MVRAWPNTEAQHSSKPCSLSATLMNPIKQFFKDLWNLPKHEFGRKYFLLPATLVFLAMALWLSIEMILPLNSLTKSTGIVTRMDSVITRVKNKPLFKQVDKELRIFLDNQSYYYTVSTSTDFGFIISKINIGDKVFIYTRPKLYELLSFGVNKRIYQLESRKDYVIDFKEHQRKLPLSVLILWISTFGFGSYYIYRWKKQQTT